MEAQADSNCAKDLEGLILTGIERLRSKLVDLSQANRLLNFKHSEKSRSHVRLIDEVPEVLFDKLENRRALQFRWIDESDRIPLEEESSIFLKALEAARNTDPIYISEQEKLSSSSWRNKKQQSKSERDLRDRVRLSLGLKPTAETSIADRARELGIDPSYDLPELSSNGLQANRSVRLQTLMHRDRMDAKLAAIRESDKTLIQDAGVNALYAAFGFIEWYESPDSDTASFAPLVFLPVEIQRTLEDGLYRYLLVGRDDDIEINHALAELLKANEGLELPPWNDELTLDLYFKEVSKVIKFQKRWKLRRWLTIGLFTFSKLAMYRDLETKRWQSLGGLESHPILSDILIGSEFVVDATIAADYDVDTPSVSDKKHDLVTEADSSQHSAVIDVLNGKNLVIQGPPGTGKSQTITNIIAAAMNNGKRVLFVAEKMAALQVVMNRLEKLLLGPFCLEVHSNKTRKTVVLKSLEDRLNYQGPYLDHAQLNQTIQCFEQTRQDLLYYVSKMKQDIGDTGLTILEVFRNNCLQTDFAETLPAEVLNSRLENAEALHKIAREEIGELAHDLQHQATQINNWGALSKHPWRGIRNCNLDVFKSEELSSLMERWQTEAQSIFNRITYIAQEFGWSFEHSLACIEEFLTKVRRLPSIPVNFPSYLPVKKEPSSEISILNETIGKLENISLLLVEISKHTEHIEKLQDVGAPKLQAIAERAKSLGVSNCTLSSMELIATERRRLAEVVSKANAIAMPLAAAFAGITTPRMRDIEYLYKSLALLKLIPRKALLFRYSEVLAEEHQSSFERGRVETNTLKDLKKQLATEIDFAMLPSYAEIRAGSNSLLTASLLGRVFSSEQGTAWRCKWCQKLRQSEILTRT